MKTVELTIDVTDAAGLGEPATIAAALLLPAPDTMPSPPAVCFALPGAGFTRHYFTTDLPGPARGSQAGWHAERGWIFVAIDHLGVGDSSAHDPERLSFPVVAAANAEAVRIILQRLASGDIAEGFPAIANPVRLGIGQSMGGCLTVIQQGRHRSYDGIAILGFSAIRTHPPAPTDQLPFMAAWRIPDPTDGSGSILLNSRASNPPVPAPGTANGHEFQALENRSREAREWLYYYDDVLPYLSTGDIGTNPPWISATVPGLVKYVLTPGIIAPEAAAVDVPVLVAAGERDVIPNPKSEPRAYLSAPSTDLFICPRMAHMHNFSANRELLWQRIQLWGEWVSHLREFAGDWSANRP